MEGDFPMSTISSIANNSYLMYSVASKGDSSITAASWLSGSTGTSSSTSSSSSSTSAATALSSSLSSLLNSYSSSSSSSATDSMWSNYFSSTATSKSTLSALTGAKSSNASLLSSYATASKTFYTTFDSTMADLKTSTNTLLKTNFNVTGATDKETASNVSTALANVKDFVSKYNDSISLFSDNSSLSNRISRLSSSFSDTTYNAKSLATIGITVDSSTGKLSVDDTKLTSAMKNTPDSVSYLLGSNGLAGKAENKVSLAENQRTQLFPSISSMMGSSYNSTTALYNPKTITAIANYASVGSFLDMYF